MGVNQYLSQHRGKLSPSLQVSDRGAGSLAADRPTEHHVTFAHALSLNVGESWPFYRRQPGWAS